MHGWKVGWFGHRSVFQYGGQFARHPCAAPMPCSSTTSPMPLGQHVFGSVFNSASYAVRVFPSSRSPAPQRAFACTCTCSRDALRAEQRGRVGSGTTAPHCTRGCCLSLGGRRQRQRQQCQCQCQCQPRRAGRREAALLGKLHTSHCWAEFRNGYECGRAPDALHISQGGVGERRPTSVLGLRGLHQIIAVAQLAR